MTGATLPDDTRGDAVVPSRSAAPPSGTVTLLFTDIEGSTRLLEQLREGYAAVLEEHRVLLREHFSRWSGHVVDGSGDAFFVAFPSARGAVSCAIEAQRALAARDWRDGVDVRVRMGLHTGEPMSSASGYVGLDVHRAARIGAAGHGGQILLSETTRDLVADGLPPTATIHDLGEHRLKDLRTPVRIFELRADGLATAFPPLLTSPAEESPPTPGEPPFRGLQAFEEADAKLFFGREDLTADLMAGLAGQPLLAIVGASGSGKSSVLRAGLIPALRRDQSIDWQIHLLTPTAFPLERLAVSLTEAGSESATARLADEMAADRRSLRLAMTRAMAIATERRSADPRPRRILIAVDQLEEVFTLCRDDAARAAFIDNLLEAAGALRSERDAERPPAEVRLVVTLRADFYAHLARHAELRDAIARHQAYIGPMDRASLRRAIEEPATRNGWTFVPGLIDLLLHDAGDEPGSLPLLSHALLETWRRRRGPTMTLRGYVESGGVRGAIATTAERVYLGELSTDGQRIARGAFLRLTELGEGTADTRRRVSRDELVPVQDPARAAEVGRILDVLAEARLVTVDEGTVEVAHEALIREWPRLRDWLGEDREGLRLHRRVTEAAAEWQSLDRDPGTLLRGARLAQASEWALANPTELNALEEAFLEAARAQEASELAEREAARESQLRAAEAVATAERRRAEEAAGSARRLRRFAVLLVAAAAISVGLAGLSFVAMRSADQNARVATARELFAASSATVALDPELAILLAREGVRSTRSVDGAVLPEADDVLHRAITSSRLVASVTGIGPTAAWSPASGLLASTGTFGTGVVEIRSVASGEIVERWSASTSDIYSLAFDHAGGRLFTAGFLAPTRSWDIASGTSRDYLPEATLERWFEWVTVSPDDQLVAAALQDWLAETSDLFIWDVASGRLIREMDVSAALGGSWVRGLSFSPDGRQLALAMFDLPHVAIVDVATGTVSDTFADAGPEVGAWSGDVAWSPDGARIATGGDDGVLRVSDARTGRRLVELEVDPAGVEDVDWLPDSASLIAAGRGGTAGVWSVADGPRRSGLSLPGHGAAMTRVWADRDGSRVVGLDGDGSARVWDVGPAGDADVLNVPAAADGHGDIAYTPDGRTIVASGPGGGVGIFDALDGTTRVTLGPGGDASGDSGDPAVGAIAISPDGGWVVTGDDDGVVRLWDASSGERTWVFDGHSGPVRDVRFSPDGRMLATASEDGSTRILDLTTGSQLERLRSARAQLLVSAIDRVGFGAGGRILAVASEDRVVLWDANAWTEGRTVIVGRPVNDMSIDPVTGRLALAIDDGTAGVWDQDSGERLATLAGHESSVTAITYDGDGRRIATGGIDGSIRLWDVATGEVTTVLPGHPAAVSALAFSPDGRRLASIGDDGLVRVWSLDLEELLGLAERELTRRLSDDECRRYLHLDACPTSP